MIRATWNGTVLAESDDTIVVEGNHYFPSEDVNMDLLVDSASHTRCPWKGKASYYTVMAGDDVNVDAAWYYPKPTFLARKIQGRIAFWRGVRVEEAKEGHGAEPGPRQTPDAGPWRPLRRLADPAGGPAGR